MNEQHSIELMEKKFVMKTGGCICGKVKYKVKLDEIPKVFNCHCVDCRKKLGGINSIIALREGALEIDKKELGVYEHPGGSGNKLKKHFCKYCAAPIFSYVEKFNTTYLYAGLLDDVSILKKAKNIHYKNSHFPFMKINEDEISN